METSPPNRPQTAVPHPIEGASAGSGVSVIIPTLNAAAYIAESIQSTLSQTHPVREVLVVDGGSRDGTQDIVRSFGEPVRLLDQREYGRKGIGAGRNMGVWAATGEWLAFLDADDWWDREKLAVQLAALEKVPGADLACTGGCAIFMATGKRELYPSANASRLWPSLRWINQISTSTVLARRQTLSRLGGFREDLIACEDWEMWVRMRMISQVVCVPQPLTYYRVLSDSTSQNLQNHLRAIRQLETAGMFQGISGFDRWLVRRRLWAAQLFGGSILARQNGTPEELSLVLRSLMWWPFPGLLPRRYASALRGLLGAKLWNKLRG